MKEYNMNINVITLPTAVVRQKCINNTFSKFNLNYKFISGIGPEQCSFSVEDNLHYITCMNKKFLINEEEILKNTKRFWLNFGELAAYLAHYFACLNFLDTEDNHIIICEDDAMPNCDMKLVDDMFNTNPDVHFINLQATTAHNQQKYPYTKDLHKIGDLVKYEKDQMLPLLCEGMTAYAIDKVGAKIYCSFIEKNGYIGPCDVLTAVLSYNNLLEIYAPYDINQYFFLDPETYKESYTFFPKTKDELKFNQITMRVRE